MAEDVVIVDAWQDSVVLQITDVKYKVERSSLPPTSLSCACIIMGFLMCLKLSLELGDPFSSASTRKLNLELWNLGPSSLSSS